MISRYFGPFSIVALSLLVSACSHKVDECNALVDIINANHAGENDTGSGAAGVKANAEFDRNSVAAFSIRKFTVPETIKLGNDLSSGFKGRLDAEEAMLDAADEDPPNVDKAKAALARVTAAGNDLSTAYSGVTAFCKE